MFGYPSGNAAGVFAGGIGNNSGNYLGVGYAGSAQAYLQPTHGSLPSGQPNVPAGNPHKFSVRWQMKSDGTTDGQVVNDGTAYDVENQGGLTVFTKGIPIDLDVGCAPFSSSNRTFGWTKKITLYDENITAAQLQALTGY